ncbi:MULTISPECIES: ATP-binding protein [Clostridium]|uniref:ATP-binding protein n=1 Tax=Clostridium senegalense TaxID=1465809 RepID=A0A6M0H0X2_9CLOT|nr:MULTISPECIES: ATP-binding protein [Clostridium]NEU03743.1 ATP-binding protein [Clostridium senegalense]
MTTRIAILGGPRCGKTTLMQHLYVEMKILGMNVGCAAEYSTDYLREKGMIETISEQYGIYLGQAKLEEELEIFDYAITDYATFVPYVYARFMLGERKRTVKEIEILKDLYGLAIRDISKYDYIFYVGREFGYEKDGVRWQDEETAQKVDEAIKTFLDVESVPYIELTGCTKDRAKTILSIMDIKSQEANEN